MPGGACGAGGGRRLRHPGMLESVRRASGGAAAVREIDGKRWIRENAVDWNANEWTGFWTGVWRHCLRRRPLCLGMTT